MSDRITTEEVLAVARLARLALSEDEVERFRGDLAQILDYVRLLEEVDVEGVEPLAQPTPQELTMREEPPRAALSRRELLAGAAETEDGFFRVPRVV